MLNQQLSVSLELTGSTAYKKLRDWIVNTEGTGLWYLSM